MDDKEEAALRKLERLKLRCNSALHLQEATATFEHAALRPLLILNGGALVVALAFLGNIMTSDSEAAERVATSWEITAFVAWSIGLVTSAMAGAMGFESQRAFSAGSYSRIAAHELEEDGKAGAAKQIHDYSERYESKGNRHRNIARIFGGVSLTFFLAGISFALYGLFPAIDL